MLLTSLFAVSFTFTATATGLEKGAPVEFFLAGKGTDRDYETLFLLDTPLDKFFDELDRKGFPQGRAPDARSCVFWPAGATVTLEPSVSDFLDIKLPEGLTADSLVLTGGTRNEKGAPFAISEQPFPVLSLYTLGSSPLLFNGIFPQGLVYNGFMTKRAFKKGEKQTFTLSWDDKSQTRELTVVFTNGQSAATLRQIQTAAEKTEVSVTAGFAPTLTVAEATAIAQALQSIDSRRVKVNGHRKGDFFYRAFTPLVKWRDRKERLQQPFELTLTDSGDKLVHIDEDWSVEGLEPKLTAREISFSEAKKFPKTDTCLIFVSKTETLSRILPYLAKFNKTVRNWYVYGE